MNRLLENCYIRYQSSQAREPLHWEGWIFTDKISVDILNKAYPYIIIWFFLFTSEVRLFWKVTLELMYENCHVEVKFDNKKNKKD